jgi:alpha-aminoadipic semialdehyde synthase
MKTSKATTSATSATWNSQQQQRCEQQLPRQHQRHHREFGLLKGNNAIGIRREDKNRWERRTPLTPAHVDALVKQGVSVFVQPSTLRIFPDAEYARAGRTCKRI